MKDTFDPYEWHNSLSFRWIALPVLAHFFSWMTGMGGVILFPILVTVAQYLIFKVHPAVSRPGFWFATLPVTYYVWVKWGPVMTYSQPNGILQGVTAYYAGQLINALFIPLIIKPGRPELLLNWLVCTTITATVWLGLCWLTTGWMGKQLTNASAWSLAQFLVYPTIALIANSVSNLFLLKE